MPSQHYEPGEYKATITSQRFGVTPEKRSPYFALEFEPTSAVGPNEFPDEVYKRELTLYLSEAAIEYSIPKLRRLGWEGDSFAELEPTSDDHFDFAGTEITVRCKYNDRGYDEWELPGSTVAKESDPEVAGKLDKLFGKALKSTAKKAKTNAKPEADLDKTPF